MEIRKIGPYIKEIDIRNNEGKETNLLGVSVNKNFMPSIANTVGTDWTKYKIIKKNQFCYIPDTSRRGDKIGIALLKEYDEALVSQAYTVFSVDESTILPEYLMLWFRRNEFDRYARFHSHGSVREIFDWNKLSNVELPLPSIEEQKKILEEYNSITERIAVKEAINNNLFETLKSMFSSKFIYFSNIMNLKSTEIGDIPNDFKLTKLFDEVDFINGYAFEGGSTLTIELPNTYKIFKQGLIKQGGGLDYFGVKNYVHKNHFPNIENYVIKPGDVLMCMTDMKDPMKLLGHTAIVIDDDTFVLNQRVGLLRLKKSSILTPLFIYLLTNDNQFLIRLRKKARPSVQVNLSKNDIIDLQFAVPCDSQIIIDFSMKAQPLFEEMCSNDKEIIALHHLKNLILSKISTN